jgi:hypothetical protein
MFAMFHLGTAWWEIIIRATVVYHPSRDAARWWC